MRSRGAVATATPSAYPGSLPGAHQRPPLAKGPSRDDGTTAGGWLTAKRRRCYGADVRVESTRMEQRTMRPGHPRRWRDPIVALAAILVAGGAGGCGAVDGGTKPPRGRRRRAIRWRLCARTWIACASTSASSARGWRRSSAAAWTTRTGSRWRRGPSSTRFGRRWRPPPETTCSVRPRGSTPKPDGSTCWRGEPPSWIKRCAGSSSVLPVSRAGSFEPPTLTTAAPTPGTRGRPAGAGHGRRLGTPTDRGSRRPRCHRRRGAGSSASRATPTPETKAAAPARQAKTDRCRLRP